jgi:hypothetical protein
LMKWDFKTILLKMTLKKLFKLILSISNFQKMNLKVIKQLLHNIIAKIILLKAFRNNIHNNLG